jgi:uncharacterized protein YukE
MSLIHYDTPAIDAAQAQVRAVASQTEQNHQQSLRIVQQNAENFGGQGSDAFQHVIATVNQRYAHSQETLQRASAALQQANEGMTQADGTSASQYHSG